MARTSKQIQGDVFRLLKASPLSSMISGAVYRAGYRPRDSKEEDAVVHFITGLPTQIEEGIVSVLIYVPDVDAYENGVFVENGERTEELEKKAQEWVDSLGAGTSCYKFRLQQTIYTADEEEIKQHSIVVKLAFKYYGGE